MAKNILLVEEEYTLSNFLSLELQEAGFHVDTAREPEEGLKLAEEHDYDLLLLSGHMRQFSIDQFASRLSQVKPAQVIIVMTYPEDLEEDLETIQRYAVSYVTKPIIVPNLLETISAIFRGRDFIDQHCSQMKATTSYRNLRIDVQNHLVYRGEEIINLTRREYDLLATLMGSKKAMTREQLLERVWKYESATETNVVDVYIRYLRGKIDVPGQDSYIKTVRGVGYTMHDGK